MSSFIVGKALYWNHLIFLKWKPKATSSNLQSLLLYYILGFFLEAKAVKHGVALFPGSKILKCLQDAGITEVHENCLCFYLR